MEHQIVEYAGTYGQSGSSDVVSSVSTCEESPTTFQTYERDVTSVEFGPQTSAQDYSCYQEQPETCVPYEQQRASPLLQPGAETSSEDGSFDILEAVVPNFFQGHQGTYIQCEQQQANQQLEAIAQMFGQDGPHGYQLHDFSQQQHETYVECEQQLGYQQLAAQTFGVDASFDFQLHDISQQLPEMHMREQQDGDQQIELASRTFGDDGSLDFDLNNVSQKRQVIYVQFGQEQGNQQPSAQMFGEDGSFHHCLQQQEGTHVQCEQRDGDEELEVAAQTSGEDGSSNFVVDVKFEEPPQVVEFVYLVRTDEQEGYYDMNGNPVCHTAHTGPVYHTGQEQRYDEPLEAQKEEELVEVFVCEECGKIQHSEDERKEHAEWHKNKDNECDICQRRFSSKISLMAHGKDHGNKKPFKCDECDRSFPYESTLKAHQRIHTGEKRFVCKICDKHFTHLNALKYHVRVHSGEKPFTCEHCDKAFRSTSTLKKHLRIHTGEKPYKCDVCDKCFLSSSHLSTHKVVHTGLKLYSCQECGKEFAQPASLTYHKRTHTGEKPYGCETCGKHFSSSSYLNEHRRRHTGETPFCCDDCEGGAQVGEKDSCQAEKLVSASSEESQWAEITKVLLGFLQFRLMGQPLESLTFLLVDRG